jgi:hypothetical protein
MAIRYLNTTYAGTYKVPYHAAYNHNLRRHDTRAIMTDSDASIHLYNVFVLYV